MPLDRILGLQHLAHRAAHDRAIIHRDAEAWILRTAIDEYPQYPAAPGLGVFDVDHVKSKRLDRRL